MSKRTQRLTWAFFIFDFLLLGAGIFSIIFSQIWKTGGQEHTLRHLVINDKDLTAGIVLGVIYIISWLISIPAFISSKRRSGRKANTTLLASFNWTLVLAALVTLVIGLVIWFFTLRERSEFLKVWNEQSVETQVYLQDTLQCCGYFNATSAGFFNPAAATGFCANVANVTANPCVTPITSYADFTLNNIFSSIFGFMCVVVALFLTSVCVINDRHEEARFKLIEEKTGNYGGFV